MTRLACAAMLLATPVSAALSPCVYDDMVAAAASVVQIDELTLGAPPFARSCRLQGTVRAVIRGDAELGDRVSVDVPCRNPDGRVGADVYTSPKALRGAAAAELHLTGTGTIAGHGAGLVLLDAVNGTQEWEPVCGP